MGTKLWPQKLWAKLTAAFVLVALVSVGLVALLTNRVTAVGFQRYLRAGELVRLQQLQGELVDYYRQQGSWAGVNVLLRAGEAGPDGAGGGYFLRVVDDAGNVVGARGGQGRSQGQGFAAEVTLPLMVDGRQVGTLLAAQAGGGGEGTRAAEQFLTTVNWAIVLAGALAIVVALLLGVLLAQRLTRPLRQLTGATQAVAAGDLSQQVPITGDDELGELADHFNQMARALQTAETQRQQLLADTAHDLRTPISVIRSHVEAMLDGVFPATPENLAVVHEETVRLGRLVDDVRTLSLAESGQLPLERAPLDMAAVVRRATAAFAPLAEADGVQLQVETMAAAVVVGDANRLHQALANLLANALRYAPQGTQRPPQVRVALWREAGRVLVRISDTGPGLTAEQQRHVFDRFWRADADRNRTAGGSGLGLAIAKGIVTAHGGDIAVTSTAGQGAAFTMMLPADNA